MIAAPGAAASADRANAIIVESSQDRANWYYSADGQATGLVVTDLLRMLIADGVIGPKTPVWTEGMSDWTPCGDAFSSSFGDRRSAPPSDVAARESRLGAETSDLRPSEFAPEPRISQLAVGMRPVNPIFSVA